MVGRRHRKTQRIYSLDKCKVTALLIFRDGNTNFFLLNSQNQPCTNSASQRFVIASAGAKVSSTLTFLEKTLILTVDKTIQHPYTGTFINIKSEENFANRSLSRTKLIYILKDKLIMTRTVYVFVTVCLHCWYYLRYSGMADPAS